MDTQKLVDFLINVHYILVLVMVVGFIWGTYLLFIKKELKWKSVRRTINITSLSYLGSFIFSQLIYPTFKSGLREQLGDAHSLLFGIFEVKSHLAALGASVAIALIITGIFGYILDASKLRRQMYSTMYATLGFIFLLNFTVTIILGILD